LLNLKQQGIQKAIPGGKYGCACMLMSLYKDKVAKIHFGKIIAMVKRAI
jgi:hypothetical protein